LQDDPAEAIWTASANPREFAMKDVELTIPRVAAS